MLCLRLERRLGRHCGRRLWRCHHFWSLGNHRTHLCGPGWRTAVAETPGGPVVAGRRTIPSILISETSRARRTIIVTTTAFLAFFAPARRLRRLWPRKICRLARRWFGRRGLTVLHVMNQGGRDVGRIESLFQQAFDQVILLFIFTARQRGSQFVKEQARPRLVYLIRRGNLGPLDAHVREPLNVADLEEFTRPVRPARPVRPIRCT